MSKKRPGRPNVLRAYCGDNDDMYRGLSKMMPDGDSRKRANYFYFIQTVAVLREYADDIPHYELLVPDRGRAKQGILEQIGRMIYQDGYDTDVILAAATFAANALDAGEKSKDIENYLRHIRVTHRK